jgi:small-conductance mechanosensitive channel
MVDLVIFQLPIYAGCLIVALIVLKEFKAPPKWYRRTFWFITGSFVALLYAETMYFLYTV